MEQIARWLTRHLDDPQLLLWLAEQGGRLDSQFIHRIENQLNKLVDLDREGKTEELAQIRAAAPKAIPRPMMRTLWRLLLSGRIKSRWQEFGMYQWQQRFLKEGMSFAVRMDLRELLTPKLHLSKASTSGDMPAEDASEDLRRSIAWKLEFADTDIESFLLDLQNSGDWQNALPALAADFQRLLHDALCLMRELGEADEHQDPTLRHVPSLCVPRSYPQFSKWVTLTDLVRDAWLAVLTGDPTRARQTALNWFAEPFPIFKRLGLFAATCEGIDLHHEWLNCLLADQGRLLWLGATKSETLRLLRHKGNALPDEQRKQIEAAILTGPPDTIFYSDADPERIARATDWLIWERLACLASSGALSDMAQMRLNELSLSHSDWRLDPDPHSEVSSLGMGIGHEEFASQIRVEHAPRTRHELVAWLKRNEPRDFFDMDDWREVCDEHLFASSAALYDLAREGLWPVVRWQIALSTWRDEKRVSRSWHLIARLVETMPAAKFSELTLELSLWLEAAAKALELREDVFLNLCRRILEQPYPTARDADASFIINGPISHTTQALLNLWFRRPLSDNNGLPSDVGPLLTHICDTGSAPCRAGRGILALHLITLFRLDPAWTQAHLLRLFDWSNPTEAHTMWSGFLWSPRPYRPLLAAFRSHFLETARHYSELGDRAEIYATLLTNTALDRADVFTAKELYDAFRSLPPDGLHASVQALVRAQQASGEQREESWRNRIYPFWHEVWPKSHDLNSKGISELLARLAIAARDEFPAAIRELQHWLEPQAYPYSTVHLLWESGLCDRFPEEALQLLSAVIEESSPSSGEELEKCLQSIAKAWPDARHDTRYQWLQEFLRRKPGP